MGNHTVRTDGCAETLTLRYLDPTQVRIFRAADGLVHVTIAGERSIIAPRFLRVCPLSDPDGHVSIREPAPSGEEVALLRSWKRLDRESQRVLQTELDRRYIQTVVKRVLSLKYVSGSSGTALCILETDRGMRSVTLRDIQNNTVRLGTKRVLLTDTEGNRYDVQDMDALDRSSLALLSRML